MLLDPAVYLRRHLTPGFAVAFATAHVLRTLGKPESGVAVWLRYTWSYRTGGSAFDRMSAGRRQTLRESAPGVFADFRLGDGSHIAIADLARIRRPVTIITADLHPSFLRRSADYLIGRLPHPRTISIANAGHAIAFDQPEALIGALRDVLSGTD